MKPKAREPIPLLIAEIPRLTLAQMSVSLHNGVRWFAVMPTTAEQQVEQSQALINLRQVQWHVDYILHGHNGTPVAYLPTFGDEKRGGGRG